MQITQTIIHFPDIRLKTRDAQKLRGYFGNLFKEHSPLLHNHYQDGTTRFAYPLVQYKVIKNVPMLVGLEEGADLLISLFLKIRELDIEENTIPFPRKIFTRHGASSQSISSYMTTRLKPSGWR